MQISRRLLLACAATIYFSPFFLMAADTPAQIKAREALEKQMYGTPSETPPAAQPKKAAPAAPAPAPKPAAPAPAAPPPVVPPPVPPAPPATFSATPEYQPLTTNTVADPAAVEKARAALRQKMNETPAEATFVVATPAPAAASTSAPVFLPLPGASPTKPAVQKQSPGSFQPMPEPTSGLAASKEQRLQNLLLQYRADSITPEQYHAERAKILAEP